MEKKKTVRKEGIYTTECAKTPIPIAIGTKLELMPIKKPR